jgi:hypothetical protein
MYSHYVTDKSSQGNTYLQPDIGIDFTGVAKIHHAVVTIYTPCFNFTKLPVALKVFIIFRFLQ